MTETVDSDRAVDLDPLTAASWFRFAAAARWGGRATVAFILFAYYRGLGYLDILAAARFLRGDWTTYVVSGNYLRTSPVLTMPIAKVPGYIAPVGTNLGMTDSLPVLSPLYRALIEIWPDRPVQLVGWEVLAAVVLTFLTVARWLDAVTDVDLRPLPRELLTLALATVATLTPFWAIQVTHPALMQQWILVWALAGAIRRCPTVLGGHLRPIEPGWTGLAPICVAAAVQPYLVPMVALPALAPDLARLRRAPTQVATKIAAALGAAVAISVVLGYLGSGAEPGGAGFGYYAADLATVLNPLRYSNWFDTLHFPRASSGGFGYLGVGALALVGAGAVLAVIRRLARRSGGRPGPAAADRWPARCLYLAIALLTIFAVLPQVQVLGHQLIDLTPLTRPFDSLTSVFRVNGRFVWPLLWLALLLASACVLRAGRTIAPCVVGTALVLQLGDVPRPTSLLRPPADVEYDAARQTLLTEKAAGATAVQLQPPVVLPGCFNQEFGSKVERIGDVLLAAAVLRLPVNSGYTARLVPKFVTINCRAQRAAYAAGHYDPRVVYVLPDSRTPPPAGLTCTPLTRAMLACRAGPAASGKVVGQE